MHYLLMVIVAVTAVASFETAGNILVVAMFVVPPATAFLLTERLGVMIFCSAIIAMLSAGLGHLSAVFLPHAFGFQSTSTSGMMALCAGMLFFVASLVSPRSVIVRIVRRQKLALRILSEDLIALLYRMDERSRDSAVSPQKLSAVLRSHTWLAAWLMNRHVRTGHVIPSESGYRLTEAGRQLGSVLVRSHRLWEQYLVSEGGVAVDRIHGQAEKLEHFTNRELRDRLNQITAAPATDPHGSRIPSEHK